MHKNIVMSVIGGLIMGIALTFGLTQSEVDAADTEVKWVCSDWADAKGLHKLAICKSPGLKCVLARTLIDDEGEGLSCFKD